MFEGCTIKYEQLKGVTLSIKITYPANEDGSYTTISVPLNEDNADYQNIQKWVDEGNTIAEAD